MKVLLKQVLCLASLHVATAQTESHVQALVKWFHKRGGKINSKVEIRRADPNDPESRFGFFAKDLIHRRELLISVPRNLLLTEGAIEEDDLIDSALPCETAFNLIKEMKLGNESSFFPYTDYLSQQRYGQLPSTWSTEGKELLAEVLRELPPSDPSSWIEFEWYEECEGKKDPFDENAAALVVARGWDYTLIPVFDMMNHRNGQWLNTDSNSIHDNNDQIMVRATQRIKKGAELYTSYNMCRDCGGRVDDYGTPEIFRDYGFVENFPQRWIFDDTLKFDLNEKADGSGELELKWLGSRSRRSSDRFLSQELKRLNGIEEDLEHASEKVPKSELDAIKEYYDALKIALKLALDNITGKDLDECLEGGQACQLSRDRYSLLDEDDDDLEDDDVCYNDDIMEFREYTMAVEAPTHYQELYFKHNPKTKDTCLDIGDTVQICANYRPHYHELVTHYPARFVESVKRVLWVGGGDSMLLHEILKYPELELAVGLELDQTVTRGSFMHFGTQPHWDNEKVEWWFGDATKSLLMLPKEYFASFDMVLVDLSETVMSLSVTDHLDVFEALSLLLKPTGIMVKNELYFETMYNVFNYTVEVHYHDVPVICSQALSISSNHIDFAHRELIDHGVETLLLQKLDHGKEHLHHYGRNIAGVQRPHQNFDEFDVEPTEQKGSPGILMIIEAENTGIDYTSSEDLAKAIAEALDNNGFESKLTILNAFDLMTVIVFKEGFVSARYWPQHRYCAFDLHLWSKFEKQKDLEKILLEVVGAEMVSSSSFRVVAGGMFGIDSWKDDLKNRGPRRIPDIADTIDVSQEMSIEDEDQDIMYDESMSFIREKGTAITVVCGHKTEECRSLNVVKRHDDFTDVVPLYMCDDLMGIADFSSQLNEKKFTCEIELLKQLRRAVSDQNKKFRGVLIDNNASFAMGQIIHSIFSKYHNKLLTEDVMIMGLMSDSSEFWKRSLVDEFRESIIVEEPVFRAEVLFNSSDTSIELDVMSSGDFNFFVTLDSVVKKIKNRTGLASEIRKVYGGAFSFQPDFLMTQFFTHQDYPQAGPLKQWNEQHPIGHQSVIQLEVSNQKKESLTYEMVKEAVDSTFAVMISDHMDNSITEYSGAGDGCLFVGLWSSGQLMVLWDGRAHIDVNIYVKHDTEKLSSFFLEEFNSRIKIMKTSLKDAFPRGFGRVVNFRFDVGDSKQTPVWAKHLVA